MANTKEIAQPVESAASKPEDKNVVAEGEQKETAPQDASTKEKTKDSKDAAAKIDEIKKSLENIEKTTEKPLMVDSHALPIKKLLATFILLIIVIPSSLFVFSIRQTRQALQQSKVIPTTAAQPTPTPNPTDNWQTYKDTTQNFAIKYPANWYTNETESKSLFGVVTKELGFSPLASSSGTADNPVPNVITIDVKENSNSLALDEVIDVFGCVGPTCNKKQQSKAITLSGSPAKLMDVTDPAPAKQAVVLKNNKVYTITLLVNDKFANYYAKADKEKIFEEMLSTFTFLDRLPTVPTSDWKTYTNTAGKYTIHYPTDASVVEQNEESKQNADSVKGFKNAIFAIPGSTTQSPTATILITVSKLPTAMTVQDALDKGYAPFVTYKSKDVQFQTISIAGLTGYYTTSTTTNYVSDAFVEKGSMLYAFRLIAQGATGHDREQLIFNTMLSTFDFTILPVVSLPNPLGK